MCLKAFVTLELNKKDLLLKLIGDNAIILHQAFH